MAEDDTRAVFVYEVPRTGEWFFVLVHEPNLFYCEANWLIDGYHNRNRSEAFGPFDTRAEALEKATVLTEPEE